MSKEEVRVLGMPVSFTLASPPSPGCAKKRIASLSSMPPAPTSDLPSPAIDINNALNCKGKVLRTSTCFDATMAYHKLIGGG